MKRKLSTSLTPSNKPIYKLLFIYFGKFFFITTILSFASISAAQESTNLIEPSLSNPRFEQLKQNIFNTPYTELPQYKVKRKLFGPSGDTEKNKVLTAARRTFESTEDIIEQPNGQKLLNANGICFSGIWRIHENSPYTGLYSNGSMSPVIARASVALSGTKQKNKRAFGMAIKLLPYDLGKAPSLNAFVLHSMGGTITKNVLDLKMDNQPPLGSLPKFSDLGTALRLRRDLEKADGEFSNKKPDASFRPVNSFANYNVKSDNAYSPQWLRLTPITKTRINQNDFRDELRTENYETEKLQYSIDVAGNHGSPNGSKKKAQWLSIGTLSLTESVTSSVCDLNLHFQHPSL